MTYKNFKTAIYYVSLKHYAYDDMGKFDEKFKYIEKYIHIDKVYLETFRWDTMIEEEKLLKVKEFLTKKGIAVSGGITYSTNSKHRWQFSSFCYSDPKYQAEMEKVITFTARHFDEIILDDFYFTNCKCDKCIEQKGSSSWSEFRLDQLRDMSAAMMRLAKETNPNCSVIIKYPNWYDEYQCTGYNLKEQPDLFDAIYTGTETRDPAVTQQNLSRYHGYFLMRYLENVKPGKNLGGWFDPLDCTYNLNTYLEQAYLTMFAQAREITLFNFHDMVEKFSQFTPLAGYAFERVDKWLDQLGKPLGIACYKPYNSSGENYLLPMLGMLGLPLEPYPDFPEDQDVVLLSQSAAADKQVVDKIKTHLKKGKTIIMTSGLARVLTETAGHDFADIIELDFTGESVSIDRMALDYNYCAYNEYFQLTRPISIPRIEYRTNDSWAVVAGQSQDNGYPVMLRADYSEGELVILTVPGKTSDLYHYPQGILDALREACSSSLPVYLSAPDQVSLFLYDNNTLIVESFLLFNCSVTIIIKKQGVGLTDLESGDVITGSTVGDETHFRLGFAASTFRVFKIKES